MLTIDDHPLLDAACFLTRFPDPIGELPSPPDLLAYFAADAPADMATDAATKLAVRDMLRHGGFKPTGRSKPASEYLIKAVEKGWLSTERGINAPVDACNVVSLHSGLPISVVDADLAVGPYRLGLCPPDTRYIFNPSGQEIDISGLVCLHDAHGPCGGPVKDSQRTKTHDATTHTLSVIWGTTALPGRTAQARDWYTRLLRDLGAEITLL